MTSDADAFESRPSTVGDDGTPGVTDVSPDGSGADSATAGSDDGSAAPTVSSAAGSPEAVAGSDVAAASGAVGAGIGAAPTSAGHEVPTVPSVKDIDVSPDKVGEVARIIDEQAGALQEKLARHLDSLRIGAPAGDTVSQHAIEAWNDVISGGEDSYEARVRAYVEGLRKLAAQLREAGEKYTRSDQDKADALGERHGLPN